MMTAPTPMSSLPLDGFRHVQQLAYEAVTTVASRLQPGVTEREAASEVGAFLRARGVRHFFHRPFAWFGDRARFAGFKTPLAFFPTTRRLEKGMGGILDVAPIVDGYTADVGYAFSCGPSAEVTRAVGELEAFRSHVLAAVRAEKPLLTLYREVDGMIRDLGYKNCHQRYPFGVLAHRVERTARPGLSRPALFGFGVGAAVGILGTALGSKVTRATERWPFWSGSVSPEARATPGLWAVEPHMGRGDIGVKWEELLVVTDTDAQWLDDDVPHVRAWRAGAAA